MPVDKLGRSASIVLSEHPREVKGVFIAAHPGDLRNRAAAAPSGGQQTLGVFHAQVGQIRQRGKPSLLLK